MEYIPNETTKIGKKGVVTIPASLRRRFGLRDGSLLIAEECAEGILFRPAIASALELYDDERSAGFLLSNAVDANDYEEARNEVASMGLNPDAIAHVRPA